MPIVSFELLEEQVFFKFRILVLKYVSKLFLPLKVLVPKCTLFNKQCLSCTNCSIQIASRKVNKIFSKFLNTVILVPINAESFEFIFFLFKKYEFHLKEIYKSVRLPCKQLNILMKIRSNIDRIQLNTWML